MISTDTILKMVSERHHQHRESGDDSLYLSELFQGLYSDHPEVKNKLVLTRKEQLLHAAALVLYELEKIERNHEAALCFLKYLP